MTQEYRCGWDSIKRKAPGWFRDAKFGLFFHWGPYSVPAYKDEWYSRNMYAKGLPHNLYHEKTYGNLKDFGYKNFYEGMTGAKFDPEAWADLVVRSGAKYAGPVSEHCDNFSLWDSRVNPVNSVNYGPRRDIVKECFEAFRKRGIKTLATFHHQWLWGWFMSTDNEADVYDPANEIYYGPALPLETNRYEPYRYPDEKFCRTWAEKIREVVDQYQPDVVYFDGRTFIIDEKYRFEAAAHFYETAPNGIITHKLEDFPRDLGVFDIERGRVADVKPFVWQADERLEDNITWCMVQNPKYRPARDIIHQLCDTVAKNGNLLLNVGPYADGSFHPDAVKELTAIGDWLAINGEAIYGSRPYKVAAEGPTSEQDEDYDTDKIKEQLKTGNAVDILSRQMTPRDFRFTTRDGFLYAIAMGWPDEGFWEIKNLRLGAENVSRVSLLGQKDHLSFVQTPEFLSVKAPDKRPCSHAFVLKIER